MTEVLSKDQFVAMLRPLAEALQAVDVDAPDASAQAERASAFDGLAVAAIRTAAFTHIDSDWLLPKEAGGVRFGRVVKDLDDGLVGMKPGDAKEIDVTFPDDYFSKDLAGHARVVKARRRG